MIKILPISNLRRLAEAAYAASNDWGLCSPQYQAAIAAYDAAFDAAVQAANLSWLEARYLAENHIGFP